MAIIIILLTPFTAIENSYPIVFKASLACPEFDFFRATLAFSAYVGREDRNTYNQFALDTLSPFGDELYCVAIGCNGQFAPTPDVAFATEWPCYEDSVQKHGLHHHRLQRIRIFHPVDSLRDTGMFAPYVDVTEIKSRDGDIFMHTEEEGVAFLMEI